MLIETFTFTILPGKVKETISGLKEWAQLARSAGVDVKLVRPDVGNLNRAIIVQEYDSMVERAKFWDNLTPEMQESIGNSSTYIDEGKTEHYYYSGVE